MTSTKKGESDSDGEKKRKPIIIRNTTDLQRLKLEKLMQNPDKPVVIPERPKERGVPTVPDFVRNVMGSSAGAGSGEFHVYRHLRRKEYARQRYLKETAERERLQAEYEEKLENNKKAAEARTAKKRAKRLKKKAKLKQKKRLKPSSDSANERTEDDDESEEESEEKEKTDDEADGKKNVDLGENKECETVSKEKQSAAEVNEKEEKSSDVQKNDEVENKAD